MHYICQDNVIIGSTDQDWIQYLRKLLSSFYQIETESSEKEGYYLVINENEAMLVNKQMTTDKKYFYDSNYLKTEIVSSFRAIPSGLLQIGKSLPRFNKTFIESHLTLVFGKRGSGKSTLAKTLITKLSKDSPDFLDECLVFTHDGSFYPDCEVYESFDEEKVKEKLMGDKGCVVIDDMIHNKAQLDRLIYMERNIPLIIVSQTAFLTVGLFNRFDYLFITSDSYHTEMNRLTSCLKTLGLEDINLKSIVTASINRDQKLLIDNSSATLPVLYLF